VNNTETEKGIIMK